MARGWQSPPPSSVEEPPPRRPIGIPGPRPSTGWTHTLYGLLFLVVLGVLGYGVYLAVQLPIEEDSALLRQIGLRLRPGATVSAATPTVLAEETSVEEQGVGGAAEPDGTVRVGATASATAAPLGTRFHVVESGDTLLALS